MSKRVHKSRTRVRTQVSWVVHQCGGAQRRAPKNHCGAQRRRGARARTVLTCGLNLPLAVLGADSEPNAKIPHFQDSLAGTVFNRVVAYSIEYEILGLGDRPGSAGVAEVSGPASAPSPAGPGAIRGCRLLRRQWPSAPPVALQSGKFRRPADFR